MKGQPNGRRRNGPSTRLTAAQAAAIRREWEVGVHAGPYALRTVTMRLLAARYGVGVATIHSIIRGRWRVKVPRDGRPPLAVTALPGDEALPDDAH